MGSKLLGNCQLAADPRERNIMFKIIKKREEGEVPSGGGWQTEGKTVRVTRQDVKIFQILCDDSCFMAQRVMWYLMKHRMRDAAEDSSSGHD